ncbi:SRPBCC domain-containing protein [Flavobacterium sp. CLA17]|uniref:SRPBCC domain-containing protein n=1 Tax=Flavobacterium sp. CLA17 TaxID=2724135 RepID=UPI0014922C7B|nr:SRPBCC domain-containing protein [Flavobacterium sp. CLA17]QSB26689.1 SRPBCC domain-containing protein [Flavobacterium sp. CLA17]
MITVQNTIKASIDTVWNFWILPEHIINWNIPSPDWHNPYAENDLKVGGKFKYTMGTKDGSMGFDFEGTYTKVEKHALIAYKLLDNRTGTVCFEIEGNNVKISETFEPEKDNSDAMQEQFLKGVMANFKDYVESFRRKL